MAASSPHGVSGRIGSGRFQIRLGALRVRSKGSDWFWRAPNFFARIKRFRRVNTRYDRLGDTWLSFVFLAALMD
jgi:hypothetical protein